MSVASLIARAILRITPAARREWAFAMTCEIIAMPGATRFALGCLAAATVWRIADIWERMMTMMERPRVMALACGVAATGLGLVHLNMTGAPVAMSAANAGALAIGLMLFAIAGRARTIPGPFVLAVGLGLLGTATLGLTADGATRWIRMAGVAIQPSLILLPAAVVLHVAARDRFTTLGIVIAATAMAMQPDRAMAGMLLLGLLAGGRRSGRIAPLAAGLAFAVTLMRPDALPPTPWADGILLSAIRTNLVAGLAVLVGTAILLAPLAVARRREVAVFGACWLGVVVAATLGNYPTPLVGFGGSAILGYLLSAAWLPAQAVCGGERPGLTVPDPGSHLFRLA